MKVKMQQSGRGNSVLTRDKAQRETDGEANNGHGAGLIGESSVPLNVL